MSRPPWPRAQAGAPPRQARAGGPPRPPALAAELALPEEPVALRQETRALAQEAPERAAALLDAGEWIAGPLWQRWGPGLQAAGMSRARFLQLVAGYRRELWLWVMGERTWAQSAGGLAGRVRRRLDGA